MNIHVLRLRPLQDIKREIVGFAQEYQVEAGFVLTCVGSVQQAALHLADQKETVVYRHKYEVVALAGTICLNGVHLHLAIADDTGRVIGGHLQDGTLVYTTAEIVIGVIDHLRFSREFDSETGHDELVVRPR
jgi:uncharacterized protein